MTKEDIILKQQEIIRNVLGNPSIALTDASSANDIEEWDSFTNIQIISEIESAFKVRFALGELQSLQNIGEMTNLIIKKA